jgi:V-type H+-transporting ATPase proteolipid subunit
MLIAALQPGEGDHASFFGYMGIASALVFANLGAAYGTAKSGVGICSMVILRPDLLFRSIIPVVMAGILGIYGLIVAVIAKSQSKVKNHYSSEIFNPFPLIKNYSQ